FSRATINAAEKTVHWTVEHKSKLITAAAIVVVVAAAALATWYYLQNQDLKASTEFSKALRTLNAQIRPADVPAQPDVASFSSAKDRATEAHKEFQTIIDKYPHTRTSAFARYYAGMTEWKWSDNRAAKHDI